MPFDKFHEECGVIGIFNHPEASKLAYLGLHALQHRGQEGAGIVTSDGKKIRIERGMGLVSEIFTRERLNRLSGRAAMGHNRYSTAGESLLKNVQPLLVNYSLGQMSVAHNGNLLNAQYIKDQLEAYGSIFHTTSDTEVVVHLIAVSKYATLADRIVDALNRVKGAYSMLFMNEKEMIAVRDPRGIRPLVLGKMDEAYVVASETCAFDLIEAEYLREIKPGEMLIVNNEGAHSSFPFPRKERKACIFEHVYFARPDSVIFGNTVNTVRMNFGRALAREHPVEADVVVPVPDSGMPPSLGYAEESGIPFEPALIRNHYVGRTFIEPEHAIRHFGVKLKLNPVREALQGKRVILVDDSIVRGTTSRKIVKMVRDAGAREVHMRVSSPPTTHPCFYGIDTPTRKELIASSHTVEDIRRYITADSLGYLSVEKMMEAVPDQADGYCLACFSGKYAIRFPEIQRNQLELF
ncbi:MAG: amidophosphoribosyltransferase [Deltaproteobacteria bacterium]|nr:amidophosphoribosyltransferase [Deltaproteobacteria bacterium]